VKTRAIHGPALALLLLALTACAASSKPDRQTLQQTFATINADCAPWDGSAFTLSVATGAGGSINISVWQAPDIATRTVFSFPDATGRVGNAAYRTLSGDIQALRGTVSFDRVQIGSSVEGAFDLTSESGKQFSGQFEAFWGNQRALCG
jgi:hypothetical protein